MCSHLIYMKTNLLSLIYFLRIKHLLKWDLQSICLMMWQIRGKPNLDSPVENKSNDKDNGANTEVA